MTQKRKQYLAVLAGVLLTAGFWIYSLYGHKPIQRLLRPEQGTGSQETNLEVRIGEKTYSMELLLQEQKLSEEQVKKKMNQAKARLEEIFLNRNPDLQHIGGNVSMPSEEPETGISLQWYASSWEYLTVDGTVKNESLTEPVQLQIQVVLELQGEAEDWQRTITIQPPDESVEEDQLRVLSWKLSELQKDNSRELVLPKELDGNPLIWYTGKDTTWLLLGALTILTVCAMKLGEKQEEERTLAERERQMQLAYPEIVSRMGLYMSAGISTRKAWERIVAGYRQEGRQSCNEAYEEMCTALYEMQNGVPESTAYERFGAKCRLPSYLKLGTLLSQNLRRGTKNLSELLEEESREAFENRKALAKKMGEECESKLLLPMILMLLTILVMIMYPAVVSFQI